jgi:hypothetical protein
MGVKHNLTPESLRAARLAYQDIPKRRKNPTGFLQDF